MRVCLVFICLTVASFALSVKSKPHNVKHRGLHKNSSKTKEKNKDMLTEQANEAQISPTLVTFKANSQEQEYEESNSEDKANYKNENRLFEIGERSDKSTAILMSEEELIDLLKKEAEEEEVGENKELDRYISEEGRGTKNLSETMEIIKDEETDGEKKLNETFERMQDKEDVRNEDKVKKRNSEKDEMYETEYHMEEEVGKMPYIKRGKGPLGKVNDVRVQGMLLEETDGSSDSEIPADLSYGAKSNVLQPLQIISSANPNSDDDKGLTQTDIPEVRKEERHEEDKIDGPAIADDYEHEMQNTEAADSGEEQSPDALQGNKFDSDSQADAKDKNKEKIHEEVMDSQKPRDIIDIEVGPQLVVKYEEEERKNESGNYTRAKPKKQNKNQRMRKHLQQRKETQFGKEWMHQDAPDSEGSSTDNTVNKAKRRRTGKWGSLVGMNPVQIRATVDLFPNSRPSTHPEAPYDPCDNFRCKRGKTCKLDTDHKPSCVCQEPTECPPSVNEFDHVCGTDNKTYDTSCELFAIKCNLEGTKQGHRLHLDYTGPCKLIPQCVDTELIQFPLRMRDWLKNVLLQLYEHDSMSPGFLTSKQRFRVKKMFDNERRLHDGDHSIELLAQDFEKNYNMYIYPVHWQFAQLDLFPSDRFLSHSELAPLRVPLVPMEHCTSRFFQECDADKDKQVSFKEWMSCFGIKNDDINVNLLF